MHFSKAQGSTEYLVILAVVLIIALVTIALLFFFPGMSQDQRILQNKVFWQSQSPVAIVQAIAADQSGWADNRQDAVLITLENSGSQPVELIALTNGGGDPFSESLDEYGAFIADTRLQWFSPAFNGEYSSYIAPPRGTGKAGYTQSNIIYPGERITIGFNPVALTDFVGTGTYPMKVCGLTNEGTGERWSSQVFEMRNFQIIFATIAPNGAKTVKSERGALILSCTESLND